MYKARGLARFPPTGPGDEPAGRGEPEWLTLGQASRFLGVAQSTLRKWSDEKRLPAFYTPGGHRRFRRGDLERFLERSGPGGRRTGPVVLVVDDDRQVRELVRVALELEGYSVREAGSAEEGMASIDERPPDLILLDVLMPHVDGWEMLRRVQESHGVGAVPVVTFSGQVAGEVGTNATSRGGRGFVSKPFDLGRLVEQTRALLG